MGALLLYILKSTICLTLFYLGFKALLSNDTFFRFNRGVLLIGIGVCLLLPFVRVQTSDPSLIQQPVLQLEKIISGNEEVAPLLPAGHQATQLLPARKTVQSVDGRWLIGLVYLSGCAVCLILTLLSYKKMLALIRSGRRLQLDRYILILTSTAVSPFSWGRYIILSEEDYEKYPDEILTHEIMHLKSHHSLDLLFMELVLWLHWFNPAVWLLKRELKDIHEYQADSGVLSEGIDATKYQLLLVKKAVGSSLYTLANSFNHSKIKKRITMMLKGKSNSWARLKLLLLVPVGLIVLNAYARPDVGRQLETLTQSKDKETALNQQQDVRDFFKRELDNYLYEKGIVDPSGEEIKRFLKEETALQELFINALGKILLNNEYVTVNDLSQKLDMLFEASSGKSNKPVAIYSLIDRGVPPKVLANILGIVNKTFQQQQAKEGAANVPILFYDDHALTKNEESSDYWINPNYVYFSIDGKKSTSEEFARLREDAIRVTGIKSELADAKGKVIEVIPHIKRQDGSTIPDCAFYFELDR